MHVGTDTINIDSFTSEGAMARLREHMALESLIYFRGCETFRGERGHRFAERASAFFNRSKLSKRVVAGHTLWIGKCNGTLGTPSYPGRVDLLPGEPADWPDPPSNVSEPTFPWQKPSGKKGDKK